MDITAALLVLALVGRVYGREGVGTYSFPLSVYVIGSYLAEFGVGKLVEKEPALHSPLSDGGPWWSGRTGRRVRGRYLTLARASRWAHLFTDETAFVRGLTPAISSRMW